jgi:hypothetical protein
MGEWAVLIVVGDIAEGVQAQDEWELGGFVCCRHVRLSRLVS